jgi:Leucine-rich repeat (LRR) protein
VNPPEGGTISPSSGTFDEGEEITFTATAADEYVFKNWSDDASGDENPMTVVMADDMFVTANFEKLQYKLSVHVEGEGSVKESIVPAKSTDYPSGTTIQLTALPDEGWEFVRWYGNVESAENPIELTMTEPMTIMCVFDFTDKEQVFVPDDNFERALIDLGLDDKLDDYVYVQLIKNVRELELDNSQISDLTGIEGFSSLSTLILSNNNLTTLDISQNRYLVELICDNNQLQELDLSQNVGLQTVNVTGNPLSCIHISSIQLYSGGFGPQGGWLVADEGVIASVDCSVTDEDLIYVPGDAFEQALIDLGLDDVLDDYVKAINVINIYDLNLSGKGISDLTGIEHFQGLLILDLSDNELASLDISSINFFYQINLQNNPLTCVQVSEMQMGSMGGGLSFIWTDDGVVISMDCGY